MAGKNFDAATDTIKITKMILVIGNVVLPCACCAQTGRANCTLGFKLKKSFHMQNFFYLMETGILRHEWKGKYIYLYVLNKKIQGTSAQKPVPR